MLCLGGVVVVGCCRSADDKLTDRQTDRTPDPGEAGKPMHADCRGKLKRASRKKPDKDREGEKNGHPHFGGGKRPRVAERAGDVGAGGPRRRDLKPPGVESGARNEISKWRPRAELGRATNWLHRYLIVAVVVVEAVIIAVEAKERKKPVRRQHKKEGEKSFECMYMMIVIARVECVYVCV